MTVEATYPSPGKIDSGHQISKTGCLQRNSVVSPRYTINFQRSTMTVHHESGPSSPRSKKFTVYLNGVAGIGQEVTVELDQLADWNDFVLELDSGITFSAPTNEVFSLNGEQLQSIEEVMGEDNLVVGSGQPFIPLQYKCLPVIHPSGGGDGVLSKSIQLRKSPIGSARKMRSGLTKSVYAIDESFQGSSTSNLELNSLLKTMSEEQVCFREVPTIQDHNHSQLPNSVIRQTLQPKPRPVSCYGAPHSMFSNETSTGVKKCISSRIPKRIPVLSHTNQDLRSNLSASVTTVLQSSSSPVRTPSTTTGNTNKLTPNSKTEKITNQKSTAPKDKSSRQGMYRSSFQRPLLSTHSKDDCRILT